MNLGNCDRCDDVVLLPHDCPKAPAFERIALKVAGGLGRLVGGVLGFVLLPVRLVLLLIKFLNVWAEHGGLIGWAIVAGLFALMLWFSR
jgi:hypothetical protein